MIEFKPCSMIIVPSMFHVSLNFFYQRNKDIKWKANNSGSLAGSCLAAYEKWKLWNLTEIQMRVKFKYNGFGMLDFCGSPTCDCEINANSPQCLFL